MNAYKENEQQVNLKVVHNENICLIIDLGMCLHMPYQIENYGNYVINYKQQRRYLISPDGSYGKLYYMAPEVFRNNIPFDGHAIDMFAVGVILFLMVTGIPPWERPTESDDRFRYMTEGYLVQMLREWNLGLSPDLMDLLQRMLYRDPIIRLSLEQVRAHPWMTHRD